MFNIIVIIMRDIQKRKKDIIIPVSLITADIILNGSWIAAI